MSEMLQSAMPRGRIVPGLADGTINALKLLGLVLMTGDHVNKYLLQGAQPALFNAGRIVMPLFAMILAINLARPSAMGNGAHNRTVGRLLVMGAIATVPFMLLGGDLISGWPLNAFFTLAVAAMMIQRLARPGRARMAVAVGLFLVGGALVEYWWPAVGITVGTWLLLTQRSWIAGVLILAGFAGLGFINGNQWALAAPALIAVAAVLPPLRAPRLRTFFYVYYPAHFAVIYGIARILAPGSP